VKTHSRDYGKPQRCAVAIHTARQRLNAIATAGIPDNGASAIELKREADVLAVLAERAREMDGAFFESFGKALTVVKCEGVESFRPAAEEARFVTRCAHAQFVKRFEVAPTQAEFRAILKECGNDTDWPEDMRQHARGLAEHDKLFDKSRNLCGRLQFRASQNRRGKNRHSATG
jgi:hypothetical protein